MPFSISSDIKALAEDALNSLHATFTQPLDYRKQDTITIIGENVNHNIFFPGAPNNSQIEKSLVTGQFLARIYWDRNIDSEFQTDSNRFDTTAKLPDGWVEVLVDGTGKQVIESSTEIIFSGTRYQIESGPRKHGLFQKKFNKFYLKPIV